VLVHAPLVSRDLSWELERLGWTLVGVRPAELGLETIARLVHDHAPAAFLGINHSPELAWAVTRTGVRYISWTVDPLPLDRMRILEGTAIDLVSVFLHRSSQVETFRALGFSQVEWLPLAAPAHRFDVIPPARPDRLPPSFVGSSLLDEIALYQEAAARWGWTSDLAGTVENTLEPLVDIALADCSFAGFRPDGSDLPRSLLSIAPSPPDLVAEALNAWLSARVRRRRIGEIGLDDLVVHGDGGWKEVVGERWKGPLADGQDMTRVYAASMANLDVPRIHQRDIATLRAFDVAASGGCLVAEPSRDLCLVFEEGREFLAYRNGQELRSLLSQLRQEPERATSVGTAARRRAEVDHRLALRAARLVAPLAS
jgi:hypothetical protein